MARIRAVLFDMDDTLLSINLGAFVVGYHHQVARILGRILRRPAASLYGPLLRAFLAMDDQDRTDGLTNGALYASIMETEADVPWSQPEVADVLAFYDREILPQSHLPLVAAHPRPGARSALETCLAMGLQVGLATNPSFSEGCIRARMGWAGIADVPFIRVSTWENSTRTKPSARYYEEFMAASGLTAAECLMVGNDAGRDIPRPDIGLPVAYVGHGHPGRVAWSGDMTRLAGDLPRLIETLQGE